MRKSSTGYVERPQYINNVFIKDVKPTLYIPVVYNGQRIMPHISNPSEYTSAHNRQV